MTLRRFAALAFVAALMLIAAPAVLADSAVSTWTIHKVDVTDRSSPPPFQPTRTEVKWGDSGPEVPGGLSDVHHGTVTFAGAQIALAIGKSSDSTAGPNVLYVDKNQDGKLTDDEKYALHSQSRTTRSGATVQVGNNLDVSLTAGGQDFPFVFAYQAVGDRLVGQLIALYYGEATVKVGDVDYVVDLRDGDPDGTFTGKKDGWTLLLASEKKTRPESPYGMTGLGEKRFADGKLFSVSITKDKLTLSWKAAKGPDPAALEKQRERVEKTWAARFAPEKEKFEKAHGMDTTRPRAKTPIHWNYVTLEKAKEMAKAQKKPLFVDVMAFWCVWCYRMDYYTYPDKEVADLLNSDFVPVKIIQEQDHAGDYQTLMSELGARGIPAMGVWTSDGKLVKFISGWSKPADFVKTLKAALDKAKSGGSTAAPAGGGK